MNVPRHISGNFVDSSYLFDHLIDDFSLTITNSKVIPLQIIWVNMHLIPLTPHIPKTVLNWWDSELIKANIKIAFTLSGLFSCAHNFELLFFSHKLTGQPDFSLLCLG